MLRQDPEFSAQEPNEQQNLERDSQTHAQLDGADHKLKVPKAILLTGLSHSHSASSLSSISHSYSGSSFSSISSSPPVQGSSKFFGDALTPSIFFNLSEKVKDLDFFKNSISQKLKDRIQKKDDIDISESDGASEIHRAVSHVIIETIEVIAFIKKSPSLEKVILFYKNNLFDTMEAAAKLSGDYGYLTDRILQKRNTAFSKRKKLKCLNGQKPALDVWPEKECYKDSIVYIPICIGFDGMLTQYSLEEVFKFFQANQVKELIVYIGEYNRLEDSVDQLERIGQEKRTAWLSANKDLLKQYNVKVLLREGKESLLNELQQEGNDAFEKIKPLMLEDFIHTNEHEEAQKFILNRLSENKFIDTIIQDAEVFLEGKLKKSSPQFQSASAMRSVSPYELAPSDNSDNNEVVLVTALAKAAVSGIQDPEKRINAMASFLAKYQHEKNFLSRFRAKHDEHGPKQESKPNKHTPTLFKPNNDSVSSPQLDVSEGSKKGIGFNRNSSDC